MKTESSSSSKPVSTTALRSPSPHRNAYEAAGIQALKPANDVLNNRDAQDGKPKPTSRGRTYGSNVHRIKNMFMQMGASSPTEAEDAQKTNGDGKAVRLTLPRAGSLNENVDHSALLKLGSSVSERVNRFRQQNDASPRYIENNRITRKIFSSAAAEKRSKRLLNAFTKEENPPAGFQDASRLRWSRDLKAARSRWIAWTALVGPARPVLPPVIQLSGRFRASR
ncbi:hypothetical protein QQF64_018547 [Cirrhinus molitorella]|uniref:Uncharacterized protein n=1 Tax=Cirrhinus molitorella TaxID=172907 RepID=A0ABR3LFH8_9TELE